MNQGRGKARREETRRRAPGFLAGAVLFWGLLISLAAFWFLRQAERREAETSLTGWATITAGAADRGLAFHMEMLKALEGLFMSSENVTRRNFEAFCAEIAGGHPGTQALVFAPRIHASEREFHEALARDQGLEGYALTERDADGRAIPAAPRPEYYPVTYVAPLESNRAALGFDLGSDPTRRAALEQARDSGRTASTGRIPLVRGVSPGGGGLLVFSPLYRTGSAPSTMEDRRAALTGFVLGVFRLEAIVDAALATMSQADTEVRILDRTDPEREELVYSRDGQGRHGLGPEQEDGLSGEVGLNLPGRAWVLRYTATPDFLARRATWQPTLVLLFGLAQTLLVTLIIRHRASQMAQAAAFSRERAEAADKLNLQLLQLQREKEAYREQEGRWRLILRGIKAGVVNIDPSTFRILRLNSVAGEILGLDPDRAVGRDCREMYWRAIEGPEPCIRPGEEEGCVIGQECLYRREDGRIVPLTRTILSAPVYGRLQLFEILFDISEKKALERQLGLAQKLESVGLLAAGIAHEINTPIQYVGDNIRFLLEGFAGISALLARCRGLARETEPAALARDASGLSAALEEADLDFLLEEIPKSIAQSLEGVERVAAIVSAMKRFSRLGSEEMALTDLNKAIENTLIVTRNEWKYVADVHTDLDPALPEVLCLPGDFNQVLVNIVVNAAQAIGETVKDSQRKGRISIATRAAEGMAEIRISDDGPGIPPENLDKIFDPFFTTKEVGKGTGQGLAIVHDIVVEKHKGSLSVDSAPGRGATFIIRLPLPPSPPEAQTDFPSPENPEDNPGDPR